ncbi:MAG TPA: hypothetical protein VFV66_17550, partial [Nonomuraea sp.]|nr:hypothetical protein [Nonomuraea sp.]
MTHHLSRRSALLGAAAVAGLALWDEPAGAVGRAAFDAARERWVALLAGGSYDAAHADRTQAVEGSANAVLRKLEPDPDRPSLWPDLPLHDPRTGNFNRAYNRM